MTGARILADDGDISEIHVAVVADPSGRRMPKQYVRDIESALLVKLGRKVDHKKISIVEDRTVQSASRDLREDGRDVAAAKRIRISSVNLHTERLEAHAQVVLALNSVEALGTAVGPSSRLNKYRLVSTATLNAIQHFLAEDCSFSLGEVSPVGLGRDEVISVTVDFLSMAGEKTICGSCVAKEDDIYYSIVCATLDAVNRLFEGLKTKEPLEYEIEPE